MNPCDQLKHLNEITQNIKKAKSPNTAQLDIIKSFAGQIILSTANHMVIKIYFITN